MMILYIIIENSKILMKYMYKSLFGLNQAITNVHTTDLFFQELIFDLVVNNFGHIDYENPL